MKGQKLTETREDRLETKSTTTAQTTERNDFISPNDTKSVTDRARFCVGILNAREENSG